jgi:hypothetical protein
VLARGHDQRRSVTAGAAITPAPDFRGVKSSLVGSGGASGAFSPLLAGESPFTVDHGASGELPAMGARPADPKDEGWAQAAAASSDAASSATSVGVRPTRTPLLSSASALALAVPREPDTIAPAWPMVLPGGAVKPAM